MEEIAIVTGASKGIGRALTISLAKRKIKVMGVARPSAELESLEKEVPGMIATIAADIATDEGRDLVLESIPKNTTVAYLVNNAALLEPAGRLMDISFEKWQYQIQLNVAAPLFLIQKLLTKLSQSRIINVSNLSRNKVILGLGAYGATKSALLTLTNYMREEFHTTYPNISVTSAYPGMVETGLKNQFLHLDNNLPVVQLEEKLNASKKRMPTKTTAAFFTWLLLDISEEEFISQEIWNIYDEFHRSKWIGKHSLPLL